MDVHLFEPVPILLSRHVTEGQSAGADVGYLSDPGLLAFEFGKGVVLGQQSGVSSDFHVFRSGVGCQVSGARMTK